MERNPLRAGIVVRAEDWKWSSLFVRQSDSSRLKALLSDWPVEKTDGYVEWVNEIQEDEDEKNEAIRHSIKKGRPFGNESWVSNVAEKFGLLATLRKRGRPSKEKGT